MHYWKAALIWGLSALGIFLISCFVYGLFNRFSFIHGASPAGIASGFAYLLTFGVVIGPLIFVGGALTGAAGVWWRNRITKITKPTT
jgi:hypothetical protein